MSFGLVALGKVTLIATGGDDITNGIFPLGHPRIPPFPPPLLTVPHISLKELDV